MPKSQLRPNPHPAPGYARRAALRARPTMLSMGGGYSGKVLATGPIAYWPLWETAGTVAECLVNPAQNGTYRNDLGPVDVSTWPTGPGIGDGNTAPQFAGGSNKVDVYSAAFNAVYDQSECTVCGWARVVDGSVWTDTRFRKLIRFYVDANNTLKQERNGGVNNQCYYKVGNGGVNKFPAYTPGPTLIFWHWAITVSESADELKIYMNGIQQGATINALGNWAGNLDNTQTLLGHNALASVDATLQWLGWQAHVVVFGSALDQPTIMQLATV